MDYIHVVSIAINKLCEAISKIFSEVINISKYVHHFFKRYFNIGSRVYLDSRRERLTITRKRDVDKFLNEIGFTITEKQRELLRRKR